MRGVFDLKAFQRSRSISTSIATDRHASPRERPEIGVLAFRCPERFVNIESGIALDQHVELNGPRVIRNGEEVPEGRRGGDAHERPRSPGKTGEP